MGSLDPPSQSGKSLIHHDVEQNHHHPTTAAAAVNIPSPTTHGGDDAVKTSPAENDSLKRRRNGGGALPLEVGTRVLCKWRDNKYHPVKVIERRRTPYGGPNDYEYYVHYTEFNRRLDEWIKLDQLDLDSVETVVDEKVEDKVTSLKMTRHQKRKIDEIHVEEDKIGIKQLCAGVVLDAIGGCVAQHNI